MGFVLVLGLLVGVLAWCPCLVVMSCVCLVLAVVVVCCRLVVCCCRLVGLLVLVFSSESTTPAPAFGVLFAAARSERPTNTPFLNESPLRPPGCSPPSVPSLRRRACRLGGARAPVSAGGSIFASGCVWQAASRMKATSEAMPAPLPCHYHRRVEADALRGLCCLGGMLYGGGSERGSG